MKELLQTLNNHAGVLEFTDGSTANYGGIRIEGNYFVYYTGKGLHEMWPQNPNEKLSEKAQKLRQMDEESLIKGEYIRKTLISDIAQIIS